MRIAPTTYCAIVVVDDGSGPEFRQIFDELQSNTAVTVLRHAVNLGKGAALKTGFNHILLAFPDCVGVVTADADGQHAVPDILSLARTLVEKPDQIVLGVRQFHGDVPLRSQLGNIISRYVFQVFTGVTALRHADRIASLAAPVLHGGVADRDQRL